MAAGWLSVCVRFDAQLSTAVDDACGTLRKQQRRRLDELTAEFDREKHRLQREATKALHDAHEALVRGAGKACSHTSCARQGHAWCLCLCA